MATIKAILDTRKNGGDEKKSAQVKVAITHRRSTAYIVLNISLLPAQWDSNLREVVNHPEKKTLNTVIRKKVAEAEAALLRISDTTDLNSLTATEIRTRLCEIILPKPEKAAPKPHDETDVESVYKRFMETKSGHTKDLYDVTLRRLKAFCTAKPLNKLHFEDITKEWLMNFDNFLARTAPSANARGIHLRNFRAVCNFALDIEITSNSPFRRFKIRQEKTRKRNFDVETLRRIFNHKCAEEWQQKYLDFFKLTFMLIGINCVDLCRLSNLSNGYVNYKRAKTHKEYSIKIESEALEIINRYRGKGQLLNYLDTNSSYRCFYMSLCNGLKEIKKQLKLDELTSYWARHSWATIAASLDIPKDTIAAALGHGNNSVTDIYIEFDMRKVDEANRKVLDWVLYGVRN